jgi:predicted dehydrogenase
MKNEKAIAGFIGAGGIARSHAYAVNSLRYYYIDYPVVQLEAVCSSGEESRVSFARNFGFRRACSSDDFFSDKNIDSVYILGPNKVHFEHLKAATEMKSIKRIYLEKPVCSTIEEEAEISMLIKHYPGLFIQVGFQYLFSPAVREALILWQSGILGKPVHFDFRYYHGDYLRKDYRDKRRTRLTAAPDGGAMADLGSHAISLALAFLGNDLSISGAVKAGSFEDVNPDSDLYSQIFLKDRSTGAAGTLAASRVSAGTGDQLSFELYSEKGALKYSSVTADYFEYYLESTGVWHRQLTGSSYRPVTSFPSGHVPPGWLRSMVHAHYLFLSCKNDEPFFPDIRHGLEVQRLVRQTAEHLRRNP